MERKNTKAKKPNNKKWYDGVEEEFNNYVMLYGKVKNIFVDTDKVQKFSLEVPLKTKNNKVQLCWVTIVNFDTENPVTEDSIISINGHIVSNNYNDKWTTEIVADEIDG